MWTSLSMRSAKELPFCDIGAQAVAEAVVTDANNVAAVAVVAMVAKAANSVRE